MSGPISASVAEPAATRRPASGGPAGFLRQFVTDRRVDQIAGGLIVIQLIWRSWAASRSYFWQDDFIFLSNAANSPLSWDYLLRDHNGHLMPGGFFVTWLLSRLAPMNHAAAAGVIIAFQAVASIASYRLLRLAFGVRPGILLLLAIYLFSPLTLTSFLWWAAALLALPMQAAMALALCAHVRYLRSMKLRHGLLGVLATAFGLVFVEKALLIPPLLVGVTALFAPVTGWRRLRWTLCAHWPVWLAYGLLSIGYLVAYLALTADQVSGSVASGDVGELAYNAVGAIFIPGILGGLWSAQLTNIPLSEPPPFAILLFSWQIAALVIVASVALRRWQAVRAWALLGGYLAVDIGLVAVARLDFIGPLIGRDPRFTADAVLVAAIAAGFALLAVSPPSASPAGEAKASGPRRRGGSAIGPLMVGATLVVYLNSSAVASSAAANAPPGRDAREYVATARDSVRQNPGLVLYDGPVPEHVMLSLFGGEARASRVVGGLAEPPRFNQPTDDLRMLDKSGLAKPVDIRDATAARRGPAPDCGWPVHQTGALIPFDRVLPEGSHAVRIGYYAGSATPAVVRTARAEFRVEFDEGLHYLYLVAQGPLSALEMRSLDPGRSVCVTDVIAGRPSPKRG